MDQCAQDSASKCNQQCRFFINELDASGMVLWFMMDDTMVWFYVLHITVMSKTKYVSSASS